MKTLYDYLFYLFMFFFLLFAGYLIYKSNHYSSPLLDAGNCYARIIQPIEEWEKLEVAIIYIDQVGQDNYGIRHWHGDRFGFGDDIHTYNFKFINTEYTEKITCPNRLYDEES